MANEAPGHDPNPPHLTQPTPPPAPTIDPNPPHPAPPMPEIVRHTTGTERLPGGRPGGK
jgi:hypothetical protein